MKIINFVLAAALAAGLLFISAQPFAAQAAENAPAFTASLAEPAPAARPIQALTGNPGPQAAVAIVVLLFGVLALFPLVSAGPAETSYTHPES